MTGTLLITNGTVLTLGEEGRVLRDAAVLCEDGRIRAIGLAGDFEGPFDRVVDAGGRVVMPGLINAHMHFYSTMVRGLGKAEPAADFRQVLDHLWWRLDKKLVGDDCYYSAMVPLIDAIRHGTTTLIDHHASPFAVEGSLDRIAEAVGKSGLRASLCYELSDRDGEEIASQGLAENARFIRKCSDEPDDRLRGLFGLHASFTLTDRTLERAAEAAADLGVGFHVHVAEALSDQAHCLDRFGVRVVERLHRLGILGKKTIAAHCVHVDAAEIDLLASTGTAVAHNPQSNMNNAVGIADIIEMSGRGVLVGLGTDAMTTNMLEEVRVALWAQHLGRDNPSVGFVEALSTLLAGNPRIASRYWTEGVGLLQEGGAADIIVVDYHPPTRFDETTLLGHVAFGLSQSTVDTTIVGGDVLMENRKLAIDVDEAEVAAMSRELSAALWDRF